MDLKEHYQKIKKILLGILALNWLVALAKILLGVITRSASITADGFHSLSDGASNIIGLIGIKVASKPKDEDHPYGHRKYETFFSLGIALLLFIIAVNLFREGFNRIFNPVTPTVDIRSFAVMLTTLLINLAVMRYELKKGKALTSDILISDAMHTRADIFITISVILGLVVIKLGAPILDPIITIIISLFIAWSGLKITRQSQAVLVDTAPIVDMKKIVDVVISVKGVKACHKIRTRGRPDDIYLDLHVQVNPDMHMETAHNISYQIENAIKKAIPGICDVVVHMEPKDRCIHSNK
ncbi:MAG: cation transporter [Candidatus Omnitrophota bacterium]|nr:MAG: cation transporter [Candidatus Omnitrophota bacterium]